MSKGLGAAIHPFDHEVTADARTSARAVRHLGRGVVRAARTKPRRALGQIGGIATARHCIDIGKARANTVGAAPLLDQDLAEFQRDIAGVEGEMLREKHLTACPLAMAIDTPPAPVVKDRLFDLTLDQLALFLDHHDQI